MRSKYVSGISLRTIPRILLLPKACQRKVRSTSRSMLTNFSASIALYLQGKSKIAELGQPFGYKADLECWLRSNDLPVVKE